MILLLRLLKAVVAQLKNIFSPLDVLRMPDDDVARIAGETVQSHRDKVPSIASKVCYKDASYWSPQYGCFRVPRPCASR